LLRTKPIYIYVFDSVEEMNALIVAIAFVIVAVSAAKTDELPVPVYLEDAPEEVRGRFNAIVSNVSLTPRQLQSAIKLFISTQVPKIRAAFQKFEQDINEVKERSVAVPHIGSS
uniref:Uncharacterized protein n=1 Tax=Parascaris univalens TaxID=6257 RepID=A0A915APF2_PARUN